MYKARWWDEIVLDWGLHIDQDTYSKVGLSHTRRGPDSVERCFVPLDYTFVDFIVIGLMPYAGYLWFLFWSCYSLQEVWL